MLKSILVVLFVFIVSCLGMAKADSSHIMYISSGKAHVRVDPSLYAPIIATVDKGDAVQVTGQANGFYHIILSSHVRGWIAKGLLSNKWQPLAAMLYVPPAKTPSVIQFVPEQPAKTPSVSQLEPAQPVSSTSYLPDKYDHGVDIAIARLKSIDIRSGAGWQYSVLISVKQGDELALLQRAPQDGWYNVLDLHSTQEGWINQNAIDIFLSKHPANSDDLEGKDINTGSNDPPQLCVDNESTSALKIRIGTNIYSISPKSQQYINADPGMETYYAIFPDSLPDRGSHTFNKGEVYFWEWWTSTDTLPTYIYATFSGIRYRMNNATSQMDAWDGNEWTNASSGSGSNSEPANPSP